MILNKNCSNLQIRRRPHSWCWWVSPLPLSVNRVKREQVSIMCSVQKKNNHIFDTILFLGFDWSSKITEKISMSNASRPHSYKVSYAKWRIHVFGDVSALLKDRAAACGQKWCVSVLRSSLHPVFDASPTQRGCKVRKCIEADGGCMFFQIYSRSSTMKPRRVHRSDPQVFSFHLCIQAFMHRQRTAAA